MPAGFKTFAKNTDFQHKQLQKQAKIIKCKKGGDSQPRRTQQQTHRQHDNKQHTGGTHNKQQQTTTTTANKKTTSLTHTHTHFGVIFLQIFWGGACGLIWQILVLEFGSLMSVSKMAPKLIQQPRGHKMEAKGDGLNVTKPEKSQIFFLN